ncbi:MAG: nitrous oxide reductase family maturation protein NosD [Lentisphaeria bacterium]|nr:nitrous oxide reductase family maturation protein NosD [Lentisphaeria bacterium]
MVKTPTLAQIITAAEPFDTIIVDGGIHRNTPYEIRKPLVLIGENGPVLDGGGKTEILIVHHDSVVIRDLTFQNAGISFVDDNAALRIEKASHIRVENNRFKDNFFAVYLAQAAQCTIRNNHITASNIRETNSGNGIHLWYCEDILIEGNQVSGQRDGIYFEFVMNGRIRNNLSENNLRYGLHFMFSDTCEYTENTFRNNGAGVAVMYTEAVKMHRNLFVDNWGSASYGLLLKEIRDSEITHNIFRGNSVGIYTESSNRVMVSQNDFLENGWGVKIQSSSLENVFTANNFIGNSFDIATAGRQNHSRFDGNYWDKYTGYDLDRDGVGDVAFRPVRLFAYIVQQNPPALILMRSLFVDLLDRAERLLPVITPPTLQDNRPLMERVNPL